MTGDWQGQGCCQVLTPNIKNTPDIFSKMNKLCPVVVPCQSNASSYISLQNRHSMYIEQDGYGGVLGCCTPSVWIPSSYCYVSQMSRQTHMPNRDSVTIYFHLLSSENPFSSLIFQVLPFFLAWGMRNSITGLRPNANEREPNIPGSFCLVLIRHNGFWGGLKAILSQEEFGK